MRARVLLLASLLAACSLDEIELTGRECPCPSELECVNGVCVEPGGAGGSGCSPKIDLQNFRVEWTTPNAIRWAWDAAGTVADFSAYELVVAENEADLATRGGSAAVFTVSENPELGELIMPDSNSPTDDYVRNTISDGHQPKTAYHGQLHALDNAGCAFVTPAVQAVTTDVPTGELELFSDAPPPSTLPAEYAVSDQEPFAGSACLSFTDPSCSAASCYENLKVFLTGENTAGLLSQNQFVTKAYLELSVSISSNAHSYWSQVWLMLADTDDLWRLEPMVLRAGGSYRTYQIPLRALTQSNVPLDYATFEASGISGFNVGGLFTPDSVVRVDEVSVKW